MDTEFLEKEVKRLHQDLVLATSPEEQDAICKAWFNDIKSRCTEPLISWAFEFVAIHKARRNAGGIQQYLTIGAISMTDDHSTSIGGNQIASASGEGTRVNVQNSEIYKNVVNSSNQIDDDLKRLLIQTQEALANLDIDEALKQAVQSSFGQLTEELSKEQPQQGVIQYLWNGLAQFASKAQPIVVLGQKLAALFGISPTLPG